MVNGFDFLFVTIVMLFVILTVMRRSERLDSTTEVGWRLQMRNQDQTVATVGPTYLWRRGNGGRKSNRMAPVCATEIPRMTGAW